MSEDERRFEERLENWGRWLREGKHAGVSNLWPILQRLPKAKDQEAAIGVASDLPNALDEADALTVQRAWSQLPRTSLQDQEARTLIGAVYAYQGCDMGRILFHVRQVHYAGSHTPIRIRRGDIEPLLERARKMMRNVLNRLDNAEGAC